MKAPIPTPDEFWMRRAIALSRKGFPAPNPHVGCVIVREGVKVGEGYHAYAGGPHAEIVALRQAKDAARGATAYVTLEPCSHYGRTPPCADALIAAQIERVVVACPDPNPLAHGGLDRLSEAGIFGDSGCLAAEAATVNDQFLFAMRHRRPRVVVKAAVSLDGRVALPSGESQWITGPEARRQGHRLRAEAGAVLVGRGTVQADNPSLTARIPGVKNQPLRIVLDPNARLSGEEKVFDDAAPTRWVREPFHLPNLLSELFESGVNGILVEGGPTTVTSFFEADLVDRLELFMAPKLLGEGPTWLRALGIQRIEQATELRIESQRRLGRDLWITLSKF